MKFISQPDRFLPNFLGKLTMIVRNNAAQAIEIILQKEPFGFVGKRFILSEGFDKTPGDVNALRRKFGINIDARGQLIRLPVRVTVGSVKNLRLRRRPRAAARGRQHLIIADAVFADH